MIRHIEIIIEKFMKKKIELVDASHRDISSCNNLVIKSIDKNTYQKLLKLSNEPPLQCCRKQ